MKMLHQEHKLLYLITILLTSCLKGSSKQSQNSQLELTGEKAQTKILSSSIY
jgi:hypothetical protein